MIELGGLNDVIEPQQKVKDRQLLKRKRPPIKES